MERNEEGSPSWEFISVVAAGTVQVGEAWKSFVYGGDLGGATAEQVKPDLGAAGLLVGVNSKIENCRSIVSCRAEGDAIWC